MRQTWQVLLFLAALTCNVAAQATNTLAPAPSPAAPAERARVFITDSQSWEIAGAGGGANGAYGSSVHGGARPQTAEIVKTFGERCPDVITNNIQAKTDYIVVLDHEGGKGALRHKNKVAVFNRVNGDSVMSKSTLSLGGSVQAACRLSQRTGRRIGPAYEQRRPGKSQQRALRLPPRLRCSQLPRPALPS